MLRWNIFWKSSYISRERKVLVKLTTIYSAYSIVAQRFLGFLRLIEESKLHVYFSSYHQPESIYRILLHANFSTLASLALNFFRFFSSSSSLVSFPSTLSFPVFFVHSYTQSLPLFLSDFTFTFIIFLVPFVFKKTFFGPFFFFLEILTFASITYSDSRYRSANERRAFFIYTCCPALCSISWCSFTPEKLAFSYSSSYFFRFLLRFIAPLFFVESLLCTSYFVSSSRNAPAL